MGKMGNSRLKTHATRLYRKAVHTRHRAGATHLTHTSHARKGGTPQRVRAERETPDARRTYHSSPPHQFVNVTVCERNLLDATFSPDSHHNCFIHASHASRACAAAPACARVVGEGEARVSARACARARCACTPRLSRPSGLCCLMQSRHSSDFSSPPSRSN